MHVSLEHGLPMVLEQLASLTRLDICSKACGSLMHFYRPLDPLLNLTGLRILRFYRDTGERGSYSNWSVPALVLLGQAQKYILDMQKVPGGRSVNLLF